MNDEIHNAIRANERAFGFDLSEACLNGLGQFHALVMDANALLHLTAPCTPEEFAVRHILESLILTKYLPPGASVLDIGAGAGLPSIPCLIARKDISGWLVESKEKKAVFLRAAVDQLGLGDRTTVFARQFEEVGDINADFVTSRALDNFAGKLPKMLKRFRRAKFRFFGGPALETRLNELGASFESVLLPASERRYLFVEKD